MTAADAPKRWLGPFAPAIDGLLDGVQIVDGQFRYVYLNDAAVRHARRPREALIGRTMTECYPGIDGTPVYAAIREALLDGRVSALDNAFTYPDGTTGTFQLRIQPMEGAVAIVSVDVGTRRHTRILDSAPDAMLLVDGSGHAIYANEQAERLLGYDRAELVGMSIDVLVPDRVRSAHAAHRAHFAASPRRRGMGVGMELSARCKDGREVPVEVGLSPLDDLVVVALRDITERKTALEQAKRDRDRLVSAIESFEEPFAIFDADDRLAVCNRAYRRLLPPSPEDPTGQTFESLLLAKIDHIDLRGEPRERYIERRRAYHAAPQGAVEVATVDGLSFRIVERITPEGGRVSTMYDLTADVKREREVRAAQAAAEVANAAKTDFLRSMSHELRTPMNAVLGFAQLLQRDKSLGERPQRLIKHVLDGGAHLLRLIDDVLDLARVEAGAIPLSLEAVGVDQVLEDLRQTLMPVSERHGATITIDPSGAGACVLADRTRLSQIVMNFASNAIKYGRERGHVVLSVQRRGAQVRISVTDDGPGIPASRQARLFQAFYRAGQETGAIEGTGIGLALSRQLAERMGGSVGFESSEGHGATFWVELQATVPGPALEAPTAHDLAGAPGLTGATILYVEDNPANIELMKELVADIPGATLVCATTGEAGVEMAQAIRPTVILLDIHLPGIDGFEALRRLQAAEPTRSIPVLALSASAMEQDVKQAQRAGFARYLTKPVRIGQLLEALEEVSRGRSG